MKERTTQQLVAIYDALTAACDHPTAEELLRRVRRSLPRISLGTVYRNLEKLRAQGRVHVLHLGRSVARYDAVLGDHDHFLCEGCGAVADIDGLPRAAGPAWLSREGYVVRTSRVSLHGLCPSCARVKGGAAPRARSRGRDAPARERMAREGLRRSA
jgi:Fur family ferric uptake transcriptional regulator